MLVGKKSAVILTGTKAIGESWYGFSNGVEYPISGDADEDERSLVQVLRAE
jgi:hypothetical protein